MYWETGRRSYQIILTIFIQTFYVVVKVIDVFRSVLLSPVLMSRGAHMYHFGYNFPSGYFMSMCVDNLVGLRCHGLFYTGFIFNFHNKGVAKVVNTHAHEIS